MFYVLVRRYRLRRIAVLRSVPLSSAPNSCAVISRRRSAPASPNGTAYVARVMNEGLAFGLQFAGRGPPIESARECGCRATPIDGAESRTECLRTRQAELRNRA